MRNSQICFIGSILVAIFGYMYYSESNIPIDIIEEPNLEELIENPKVTQQFNQKPEPVAQSNDKEFATLN